MSFKLHVILQLLLFPALLTASPSGTSTTLSMQQATERALEQSPDAIKATQELESSERDVLSAWADLAPTLDLGSKFGLSDTKPDNSLSPWNSSLDLTVKETLYDNGITITNLKMARAKREASRTKWRFVRERVTLAVRKAFYDYSFQKKSLSIRQEQNKSIEKQLKLIESQYRQGRQTRRDFLRARARLQRSQVTLSSLLDSLYAQKIELQKIIGGAREGESLEFEIVDIGAPPSLPDSFDWKSTFTYKINQFQTEINRYKVDLVWREYWPRLTLDGGATYTYAQFHRGNFDAFKSSSLQSNGGSLSWQAQIQLNFNLWDWGIRNRDLQNARATEIIENATVLQSNLETEQTVLSLGNKMKQLRDEYKLNQDLLKMEEESFQFIENEYRQGKVAYLDMITALNELSDSRINYYKTYFSLKASVDEYHHLKGTLYEPTNSPANK